MYAVYYIPFLCFIRNVSFRDLKVSKSQIVSRDVSSFEHIRTLILTIVFMKYEVHNDILLWVFSNFLKIHTLEVGWSFFIRSTVNFLLGSLDPIHFRFDLLQHLPLVFFLFLHSFHPQLLYEFGSWSSKTSHQCSSITFIKLTPRS